MNATPTARTHASFRGRIGLAAADITPPVGVYARNWGAASHDVAEAVHRPLAVHVLSISTETGSDPLILVDADLGWWRPLEVFRDFQRKLLEACGLESAQLIFALTHTHASAPLMHPDPSLAGSELLGPWLELILETTAKTIRAAIDSSFDATLDWHTGRCGLAANRDLPDPDVANDRVLCGYNPAAAADDTLTVGRIHDPSGDLKGVIVNYACHPTTLAWANQSISPDYIGAMRASIVEATGAAARSFCKARRATSRHDSSMSATRRLPTGMASNSAMQRLPCCMTWNRPGRNWSTGERSNRGRRWRFGSTGAVTCRPN